MTRSRGPRTESRRAFLGGLAAFAVSYGAGSAPAEAEDASDLEIQELSLPGDPALSNRALVLTPRGIDPSARLPVLILLHGLGETWDPKIGVRAWNDRYGLSSADSRLRHAPITLAAPNRYLSSERLARINAELSSNPYRGAILVCPFTPNIHHLSPEPLALDRYADWIETALLPAVRARTPARTDALATAIDGCSLGGYMALGVFLRKPQLFSGVGAIQPAIGEKVAPLYAELIRRTVNRYGPRAVHIETSSWDPEIVASEALSKRLRTLQVPHDYAVLPGGHDQIFLREIGTLEMLLWHDRRFSQALAAAPPPAHPEGQ